MKQLLLHIIIAAMLGAVIGAVGLFILAEGLPEGAIMGGIIGGSVGILIAARIDGRRSAMAFARAEPEAAQRSAAVLSSRNRRIRQFQRDRSAVPTSGHFMNKLEDFASSAAQPSDDKAEETKR